MDDSGIYWILFFTLSVFFLTSVAAFLTRGRRRREPLTKGSAPVVVTSATHTAPGGYPVTQLPPPGYPAGNSYSTMTAYPAQTTSNVTVQMPMPHLPQDQHQPPPQQMPMPMPMPGMQTHGVAYPPYPGAGASNMNPPTYDMAMANPAPSVIPSGYEKQAAYNPNFGQ
ncbi:splicing factor, proline- and glutamine-rich isoform X1 [Drosophila bipectinata]|uniref:splicing factor, proline- and glutamine-rich isoform X1 n=1 Tax=Drosophila bipectinata TaxID=42026 RepID=UPI001C8A05D5|nr:splicing factor, proline- and glutamine-rich isoform X1 [Drosophila bipectinata]